MPSVEALLAYVGVEEANAQMAFVEAATRGHLDLVMRLAESPFVHVAGSRCAALRRASGCGRVHVVLWMLSIYKEFEAADISAAAANSAMSGNASNLGALFAYAQAHAIDVAKASILRLAASAGDTAIIALVLAHPDPSLAASMPTHSAAQSSLARPLPSTCSSQTLESIWQSNSRRKPHSLQK